MKLIPKQRILPNGTKDEINVTSGVKTQRVSGDVTLSETDIDSLHTSWTNVDGVKITFDSLPNLYGAGQWGSNGRISTSRTSPKTSGASPDDTEYEWQHYINPNDWYIIVPKGYYVDLASAKADLAGTTLTYQLARPKIYQSKFIY